MGIFALALFKVGVDKNLPVVVKGLMNTSNALSISQTKSKTLSAPIL
jgi:hypothetical protein